MASEHERTAKTERSNPDPVMDSKGAAVRQALSDSHRQLQSYLQRRVGSAEEAVDVMQSFMLRALDRAYELGRGRGARVAEPDTRHLHRRPSARRGTATTAGDGHEP